MYRLRGYHRPKQSARRSELGAGTRAARLLAASESRRQRLATGCGALRSRWAMSWRGRAPAARAHPKARVALLLARSPRRERLFSIKNPEAFRARPRMLRLPAFRCAPAPAAPPPRGQAPAVTARVAPIANTNPHDPPALAHPGRCTRPRSVVIRKKASSPLRLSTTWGCSGRSLHALCAARSIVDYRPRLRPRPQPLSLSLSL